MIFPWGMGGWWRVGWMDGRMTPVSIPTGERKSLSEHNRKETERKQACVFLDIKSLPVGRWAASPCYLQPFTSQSSSSQAFGRQKYWSNLFHLRVKSVHAPVGPSLRWVQYLINSKESILETPLGPRYYYLLTIQNTTAPKLDCIGLRPQCTHV